MNAVERRAFEDRAAERELYKVNALARGFVVWIRFKPGVEYSISDSWPGKIIWTEEMMGDCVYARL